MFTTSSGVTDEEKAVKPAISANKIVALSTSSQKFDLLNYSFSKI